MVTFHRISDLEEFVDSRVPIGRPIDNVRLLILDENLGRVPLGAPGELFIAGAAVGVGYLNDTALSQRRFPANPLEDSGEHIYRTGDRARFLRDGSVDFLGRADSQIKLRGYRIELGEIEEVIREHPAAKDVALTTVEAGLTGQTIVTFVVPNEERAGPITEFLRFQRNGELVDHSTCELPNHMLVVHRNRSETDFLYREIFEERAYFRHGIQVACDAIVFDVGANIGLFGLSLLASRVRPQIFAFEPIPPIFDALRLNMQAYRVNAQLFDIGLSDAPGVAEFSHYPHASILSGQYADQQHDRDTVRRFLKSQADIGAAPHLSDEQITELLAERLITENFSCTLKTVSQIIRDHDLHRIDLLKIDVEKSELAVLRGIEPVHWPLINQVVLEVHDINGRVLRVCELLTERGFKVHVDQDALLESSGMFSVFAHRQQGTAPFKLETQPPLGEGISEPMQWRGMEELKRSVRTFIAERLPEHMVPGVVILLDELPKTLSGKLDRKELQRLAERGLRDRMEEFLAPRSRLEQMLATIWSEILGNSRVSILAHFFDDLGGDSLLATQVAIRIGDLLNVDVALRLMFEHPTIENLSAALVKEGIGADRCISEGAYEEGGSGLFGEFDSKDA